MNRAEMERAIADAQRPASCACGRVFASAAALTVHRDPAAGCLPGDAYGQLVLVDGVWALRGSGPAR